MSSWWWLLRNDLLYSVALMFGRWSFKEGVLQSLFTGFPAKSPTSSGTLVQSIKNWMGPYQRTPKEVARAMRFSGLGVRSVGPVGDFLDSDDCYVLFRDCTAGIQMGSRDVVSLSEIISSTPTSWDDRPCKWIIMWKRSLLHIASLSTRFVPSWELGNLHIPPKRKRKIIGTQLLLTGMC